MIKTVSMLGGNYAISWERKAAVPAGKVGETFKIDLTLNALASGGKVGFVQVCQARKQGADGTWSLYYTGDDAKTACTSPDFYFIDAAGKKSPLYGLKQTWQERYDQRDLSFG